MEELLVILIVEDDQQIQNVVEEALTDPGFEPAIVASGKQAVTLLKGAKITYRALVTDVNLRERWTDGRSRSRPDRSIRPSRSST